MDRFIRIFLAIFLIGMGMMLVLANLGMIDFGFSLFWYHIYPVFILGMGLKWLFDFVKRRGAYWFAGLFCTVFGSLLLLDRLGYMTFHFSDIYKLWPLWIIYVGFQIFGIGSARRNVTIHTRNGSKVASTDTKEKDKQTKHIQNFVVGGQNYSEPNWKVEPMHISTMAGDFYLDFSKAFIPEKEIPIYIRSLAGDVRVLLPENIEFRIEATVVTGEIEILGNNLDGVNRSCHYETDNYEHAERKLDFVIKLTTGDIRLNHV